MFSQLFIYIDFRKLVSGVFDNVVRRAYSGCLSITLLLLLVVMVSLLLLLLQFSFSRVVELFIQFIILDSNDNKTFITIWVKITIELSVQTSAIGVRAQVGWLNCSSAGWLAGWLANLHISQFPFNYVGHLTRTPFKPIQIMIIK